MSKAKGCLAVTAITVLNVCIVKMIIGDLAVMLWGDFNRVFFESFALWWVFFGALYLIAAMETGGVRQHRRTVLYAVIFGLCVTVLKIIPDTLIYLSLGDLLSMGYWYGIEDILIGTAVMLFLVLVTGSQNIRKKRFLLTSILTVLGAAALQSAAAAYYWSRFKDFSSKNQMAEMLPSLYMIDEVKNLQLINSLIFIVFYVFLFWQISRKTNAS